MRYTPYIKLAVLGAVMSIASLAPFAHAAIIATGISPSSGDGNFTASYTGVIGPSARLYIFTDDSNFISSNGGIEDVAQYPSGTSPISVNLASLYSGITTLPVSGAHYYVLSNTVSTNCTNGTYAGCTSNGGTVNEFTYTLIGTAGNFSISTHSVSSDLTAISVTSSDWTNLNVFVFEPSPFNSCNTGGGFNADGNCGEQMDDQNFSLSQWGDGSSASVGNWHYVGVNTSDPNFNDCLNGTYSTCIGSSAFTGQDESVDYSTGGGFTPITPAYTASFTPASQLASVNGASTDISSFLTGWLPYLIEIMVSLVALGIGVYWLKSYFGGRGGWDGAANGLGDGLKDLTYMRLGKKKTILDTSDNTFLVD